MNKFYKKPTLKKFREVCDACRGVKSRIAKAFGVARITVDSWCKSDPQFAEAVDEYKGQLLDECLNSARALSIGIPKLNEQKQIVGWVEKPDGYMLRYLISTLGRREGFGDSLDVTSNGEAIKQEPIRIEVIDRRDKVQQPDVAAGEEND